MGKTLDLVFVSKVHVWKLVKYKNMEKNKESTTTVMQQ